MKYILVDMSFIIRQMRSEDIQQVIEIDKENFPAIQPTANYKRELINGLSYYIVACNVKIENNTNRNIIVGMGGFWLMAGEAHIINLAVRQAYRHKGIGELLLINLLDLAYKKDADIMTLEVRMSNKTAKKLYEKYGFIKRGLRRGYYLDDKEDALIMTTDYIKTSNFQVNLYNQKKKYQKKWGNIL